MSFSLKSIPLHNSFLKLGKVFLSEVKPTPFKSDSTLIHFNKDAASLLDLEDGAEQEQHFVDVFSGEQALQTATPFAMLYAGHQFGHLNPQLGDGRAIIIAEVKNEKNEKWELQLKGSGATPYSRGADGRAVLRSTIREYLCSEAMHGLGIPTTRALCMTASDDEVYREDIETGAILTRLAPSHIRFGSFEIFYYRQQYDHIRTLADHVIEHHYLELRANENPYLALLSEIIKRTAKLIVQWQSVGFAHGVMNTDNMSILGLTLDYGPYGFLDNYDPGYICNHSDHEGRYAFDQQPNIGLFNLSCLAQALLPLIDQNPDKAAELAKNELENYQTIFVDEYAATMRKKLGLEIDVDQDQKLLENLLKLMTDDKVDHTIFFRRLCDFDSNDINNNNAIRDIFMQRDIFDLWATSYQARLAKEVDNDEQRAIKMKKVNPKYILRNYMAEVAIKKAEQKDYSEIDKLFRLLQSPFDEQPENEGYAAPLLNGHKKFLLVVLHNYLEYQLGNVHRETPRMNTKELINIIETTPTEIDFDQVIAVIDNDYNYTPTQFYNGLGDKEVISAAGTNEGSCKIFAFADINDLNESQTLSCFGKYYRQDVLCNLGGTDHANIRNFMKFGWEGVHFDSPPLAIKK